MAIPVFLAAACPTLPSLEANAMWPPSCLQEHCSLFQISSSHPSNILKPPRNPRRNQLSPPNAAKIASSSTTPSPAAILERNAAAAWRGEVLLLLPASWSPLPALSAEADGGGGGKVSLESIVVAIDDFNNRNGRGKGDGSRRGARRTVQFPRRLKTYGCGGGRDPRHLPVQDQKEDAGEIGRTPMVAAYTQVGKETAVPIVTMRRRCVRIAMFRFKVECFGGRRDQFYGSSDLQGTCRHPSPLSSLEPQWVVNRMRPSDQIHQTIHGQPVTSDNVYCRLVEYSSGALLPSDFLAHQSPLSRNCVKWCRDHLVKRSLLSSLLYFTLAYLISGEKIIWYRDQTCLFIVVFHDRKEMWHSIV